MSDFDDAIVEFRENISFANDAYNLALDRWTTESWFYSGSSDLERIILSVKTILHNIITHMGYMMGFELLPGGMDWVEPWLFENIPGVTEYELTWEKIVNVWMFASLEGQQFTIGTIDYLRKFIWDKPFNFPLIAAGPGGG